MVTLPTQIHQVLVILSSRHVARVRVAEDTFVFLEPIWVFKGFKVASRFDAVLRAQLLVSVLGVNLLAFLLLNVLTNRANLRDQVHVVGHDLQVVCFVDLAFDLEAFLERLHGVIEEFALVLILLLDVGVDVAILRLLILNELVKGLVYGNLQLRVIVSVLDYLVDGIFEVADNRVVVANNVTVRFNLLLDETLAHTQVLHHETE